MLNPLFYLQFTLDLDLCICRCFACFALRIVEFLHLDFIFFQFNCLNCNFISFSLRQLILLNNPIFLKYYNKISIYEKLQFNRFYLVFICILIFYFLN